MNLQRMSFIIWGFDNIVSNFNLRSRQLEGTPMRCQQTHTNEVGLSQYNSLSKAHNTVFVMSLCSLPLHSLTI